jgi:hypothetical protein
MDFRTLCFPNVIKYRSTSPVRKKTNPPIISRIHKIALLIVKRGPTTFRRIPNAGIGNFPHPYSKPARSVKRNRSERGDADGRRRRAGRRTVGSLDGSSKTKRAGRCGARPHHGLRACSVRTISLAALRAPCPPSSRKESVSCRPRPSISRGRPRWSSSRDTYSL